MLLISLILLLTFMFIILIILVDFMIVLMIRMSLGDGRILLDMLVFTIML